MFIIQLSSTYHHAKRYRQIMNVLIKYGFGYIVEKAGIILPKGITRENVDPTGKMTTAQKVVMMLQELGPTFVKLGQVLSTRPDLIPKDYIEELKKLQDNVAPFSFKEAKDQMEEDLGDKTDHIFLSIEEKPLAAASIGQVHRAVLKNGQDVVVKVRRPGIDKIITADLEIMLNLARLIEKHIPEVRIYDPIGKIEEFADAMHKELDFTREGFNIDKFRQNFEGDETIYVPKVFWEATAQKVLTIEYIKGYKVTELDEIINNDLDRKQIAVNGAKAMMKQIFIHGFFHADPHPGNIIIRPDGKIVFIDFGIVGRIDKYTKNKLADLIVSIINKDTKKIIGVLLELSQAEQELNISEIELDVEDLLDRYYGKDLKNIDMSKLLSEVFTIVAKYKIILPSNFTLLLKSLITIEGVGLELDPDFNIFETAKPFVNKMLRERYNPQHLLKTAVSTLQEFNKSVMLIPKLLNGLYQRTKIDSMKIDFDTRGTSKVISELNKMVNRLVFSLIVASLIIGSSLIIQADVEPFLLHYPLLGVAGFVTAGLLGVWLIASIIRTGRM
ncbi:2-polyprenylphenol 6-hydroxylase [Tepidanaerobacter acetatoxydans Re1]|uniref:2-polyprenylphenol 6-hydroxylase n=1 Tax=Tepidanaerobacter acetatoxydans (strain DSM 21804 / JCM 16047 / Re1) TaxID=1209989 RepID=F4LWU3_TEPAE|nr:2-polyprenylphenol 6-hydroxylase [Tepidanaerobacter acetatoxydans]AEE91815.1 2-polyprenylphenol 6-hydroxylase [Tepidanaerobacter acetatoxydans Re1]CCP26608.1 2-polyprenylphenol 6-hydroxylase [Tepidanaerobacter acetatoxydans Re1]